MSLARCCRLGQPRSTASLLRSKPTNGAPSIISLHHHLGQTRLNSHLSLSRGPVPNLGRITPASSQAAFTPLRSSLSIYPARKLATMAAKLDPASVKQHHADSPPSVVRLEIEKHFEALTDKQKRYAHYISK
ncbi:hypothetical protein IMZ48_23210 [Candidatus Bathyarchaeota archaeon]|nr:hypothetical protein [Candidatus Bathyarchaeota archaeon]